MLCTLSVLVEVRFPATPSLVTLSISFPVLPDSDPDPDPDPDLDPWHYR
ncbi:hypothetical protein E2C01_069761 [Portunus trituberculatus]|uniref:Uncharacterized protein n=1 Tax=Portunus trituberculatus TaxID=210409 RepID=A0A5B7HZT3_PORTR|nr:hypothetical protein [Portunus trituberculatus]